MSEFTAVAPEGAHFEFSEVSTSRGQQSLGEQPILVWDSVDACVQAYGEQGVKDILDGTSVRVSMQSIARRGALAKKSWDEIAAMQIAFRPGKRTSGPSTPVSRAQKAAKNATTALGDNGDAVAKLLERIASGELSQDQLAALIGG